MSQSPDIPQTGQPWALPRVRRGVTTPSLPAFVYPYQVVRVKRRDDLALALEHYCQVPSMPNSLAERRPAALRHLVEWIYPALRWFCRIYDEPIPAWLQGNGWADNLSPKRFATTFGSAKPLQVAEWHEDPRHAGKRG